MTYNAISKRDREMLHQSCLVISDDDLVKRNYKSIDDINLEYVKGYSDLTMSNMVLYDGELGQKVLKLRMQKVRRNGVGGYYHYYQKR